MHVLIVGAGITGLLVAQGLKREGIPFTIFESEASASVHRPREWSMTIHWSIPLLKNCLSEDQFDRIRSTSIDPSFQPREPEYMPALNGATGEVLKNVPMPLIYRVSRRKFRALCAENIDIQYGKTIRDVKYDDAQSTVTAIFEDGSEATGTLLVGADGAQSKVRTLIFGSDRAKVQTLQQYNAINTTIAYNDAEKAAYLRELHPIFCTCFHPGNMWAFMAVLDVPDPEDPSTWLFQLFHHWRASNTEEDVSSLTNLKARAEAFAEPFKSAMLWIPEGTKINHVRLAYWIPEPWDNKDARIILAGDAGHPMTYNRGQGLNHCIGDASNLTRKLASAKRDETTIQQAIDSYCKEMIDRAGEEVRLSTSNTEMFLDWNRFMESPFMQRGTSANGLKSRST